MVKLLAKRSVDWLLPIYSERRMIGRVLKQICQEPKSIRYRFNFENLKNFLKYRKYNFFCPICGNQVRCLYDFPNTLIRREHKIGILRETLQCQHCFSSLRQRALAVSLLNFLDVQASIQVRSVAELSRIGLGDIRILDTDNFSAISKLLRNDPNYIRCSYLPERRWGEELGKNHFNIDLEKINFENDSFNIVLTSEVLEHVRNSQSAHKEIYRIVKSSGAYIFTVPFDECLERNWILVDTTGEHDVFLVEPHYHGDPLTGQILTYRVYGQELIQELTSLGFEVDFRRINATSNLIVDGDVFTAIKCREHR